MKERDSNPDRRTGASSLAENELRLNLPTSWTDMQDGIWLYVCRLLAIGVPPEEVQTYLVIRSIGPKVAKMVPVEQIAWCSTQLDFLATPPTVPARPSYIGKVKAVDRELHGVPFSVYLMCENCYQGVILNPQNLQAADDLLNHLYPGYLDRYSRLYREEYRAAARYIAIQWWAALKTYFARLFRNLFRPAAEGARIDMREIMTSQIRALTGGDITKEQAVLRSDVWSALTELDAKAREAEEINKKQTN